MKKIIAFFLAAIMMFTIVGCGSKNGTTSEETGVNLEMDEPTNISENNNDEDQVFLPQDVSDETIQSIRTYDDYLTMYQMIIEDYYSNYEAAIKDTLLYDEQTFATLKETQDASLEQQKELYKDMMGKEIVGKDTLVNYLIDCRDSLKSAVDQIADSLK